MKISSRTCCNVSLCRLAICFKSNFDLTQTLIVLIEFTPFVNFLTNDNSCCCCTNATKTESANRECRIYGSCPAGRDNVNVEFTDPGRSVLMILYYLMGEIVLWHQKWLLNNIQLQSYMLMLRPYTMHVVHKQICQLWLPTHTHSTASVT